MARQADRSDADMALAVAIVIGELGQLALHRAAALAGVSRRRLQARLPALADLVPAQCREHVLRWPEGVAGGKRTSDADLAAAIVLLVESTGRYNFTRAAELAGCDPYYLKDRLPEVLALLPPPVRRVVEGSRPHARPRLSCSDQDLASAVELVHASAGWVCLERVAALVGLNEHTVRQRLPGCLYLLAEGDRQAALARLEEEGDERADFPADQAPPPAEPTDAPAGSEEKIRILAERAARGEALFHPGDGARMVQCSDRGEGGEVVRRDKGRKESGRVRRGYPLPEEGGPRWGGLGLVGGGGDV